MDMWNVKHDAWLWPSWRGLIYYSINFIEYPVIYTGQASQASFGQCTAYRLDSNFGKVTFSFLSLYFA